MTKTPSIKGSRESHVENLFKIERPFLICDTFQESFKFKKPIPKEKKLGAKVSQLV